TGLMVLVQSKITGLIKVTNTDRNNIITIDCIVIPVIYFPSLPFKKSFLHVPYTEYIMEGDLKKRKITPCCPLSNSVFVGGQLTGKSSQEIKDFITTKFSVDVSHVLKTLNNPYGHAHFKTENDAGIFYQR
ncbi:264_t:CDS:2, partial [Funneliformis caledonium]